MSNSETVQKRDSVYDIMKGILIASVVLGHSSWKYVGILYWFHMPAFFIISGVTWDISKINTHTWLIKRTKSLFVPYIIWFIIETLCRRNFNINTVLKFMWGADIIRSLLVYNCIVYKSNCNFIN